MLFLNQNHLKVFPKKSILKIAVKDLWFFFQLNPEFGFLFYLIEFYWDLMQIFILLVLDLNIYL